MVTHDIYVSFRCGAYTTAATRGVRSSSTMSAEAAARRQAEKLFGPALWEIRKVDEGCEFTERWQAVVDNTWEAYCWASGEIEFGPRTPPKAIRIATGPKRALVEAVAVRARHAYPRADGKKVLLVPGIPELPNIKDQRAKGDALMAWLEWCRKATSPKTSYGVVFDRMKAAEEVAA